MTKIAHSDVDNAMKPGPDILFTGTSVHTCMMQGDITRGDFEHMSRNAWDISIAPQDMYAASIAASKHRLKVLQRDFNEELFYFNL